VIGNHTNRTGRSLLLYSVILLKSVAVR